VDAEKKIHTSISRVTSTFRTVNDQEEKFETSDSFLSVSPLTPTKSELADLFANRREFLDLVRTYMHRRHVKKAGNVQDLPLNFTITNKASAKVSNTILKKFASVKEGAAGGGFSNSLMQLRSHSTSSCISQHSPHTLFNSFALLSSDTDFNPSLSSNQLILEKYYDLDNPIFSVSIPRYIDFSLDTQSLLNTKVVTA